MAVDVKRGALDNLEFSRRAPISLKIADDDLHGKFLPEYAALLDEGGSAAPDGEKGSLQRGAPDEAKEEETATESRAIEGKDMRDLPFTSSLDVLERLGTCGVASAAGRRGSGDCGREGASNLGLRLLEAYSFLLGERVENVWSDAVGNGCWAAENVTLMIPSILGLPNHTAPSSAALLRRQVCPGLKLAQPEYSADSELYWNVYEGRRINVASKGFSITRAAELPVRLVDACKLFLHAPEDNEDEVEADKQRIEAKKAATEAAAIAKQVALKAGKLKDIPDMDDIGDMSDTLERRRDLRLEARLRRVDCGSRRHEIRAQIRRVVLDLDKDLQRALECHFDSGKIAFLQKLEQRVLDCIFPTLELGRGRCPFVFCETEDQQKLLVLVASELRRWFDEVFAPDWKGRELRPDTAYIPQGIDSGIWGLSLEESLCLCDSLIRWDEPQAWFAWKLLFNRGVDLTKGQFKLRSEEEYRDADAEIGGGNKSEEEDDEEKQNSESKKRRRYMEPNKLVFLKMSDKEILFRPARWNQVFASCARRHKALTLQYGIGNIALVEENERGKRSRPTTLHPASYNTLIEKACFKLKSPHPICFIKINKSATSARDIFRPLAPGEALLTSVKARVKKIDAISAADKQAADDPSANAAQKRALWTKDALNTYKADVSPGKDFGLVSESVLRDCGFDINHPDIDHHYLFPQSTLYVRART